MDRGATAPVFFLFFVLQWEYKAHFEEEPPMIQQAIDRVRQMERYFDVLQTALDTTPGALRVDSPLHAMLQSLTQYYEGGQWLHDYELDEQGLLPQTLKRGVLSQDSLYDFLECVDRECECPGG